MAESSAVYQVKDSKPMKKISGLTAGQSLEILQQAALNCNAAGIRVRFSPYYHGGNTDTIIVLDNVDFINGNLVARGSE